MRVHPGSAVRQLHHMARIALGAYDVARAVAPESVCAVEQGGGIERRSNACRY